MWWESILLSLSDRRHYPVSLNIEDAFIKNGFSDWNKAMEKFQMHQLSHSHQQAVDLVMSANKDVGEMVQKGMQQKELKIA